MKNQKNIKQVLLIAMTSAISFYVIRAIFRKGDFVGYVNAGNLVLNGQNIYDDYLNTWPPFFSLFCVPLSIIDQLSPILIRAIWLVLSLVAMFWMMRIVVNWLYQKRLAFPFQASQTDEISFTDWKVFVPAILILRYVLDNIANIQINMFLLLGAVLVVDLFLKKRTAWAGILLAFIISLKVYPIFLLLFFGFKRAFKVVAWTLLGILLFNSIVFIVFGIDTAVYYYQHWWTEIAGPFASVSHKNQSLFSMLRSWLADESPGLGIKLNVVSWSIPVVKKVAYSLLFLAAIYPMIRFRKAIRNESKSPLFIEFVFILTAIPILSPLSWKAYFIFLWPGYLFLYHYFYFKNQNTTFKKQRFLKVLFMLSVLLTVVSTDLFLGPWLADFTEVISSITIGTILMLFLLLIVHKAAQEIK